MKRMPPPSAWRMKKEAGRSRSLARFQQANELPWTGRTGIQRSVICFEYNHKHAYTVRALSLPLLLSSWGLVLDRESLTIRRGLLSEKGSSLSWYIKASTAAGTGSCQDTHTHIQTHKQTKRLIVNQVTSSCRLIKKFWPSAKNLVPTDESSGYF